MVETEQNGSISVDVSANVAATDETFAFLACAGRYRLDEDLSQKDLHELGRYLSRNYAALKRLCAGDSRMEYLWCSTQCMRCACICLLRTGLLAEESLPTRNRFKSTSCLPITTRRSPSLERTRGRRFLFFIHNLMIEKICANVKRASVCVE